MSCNNNNFNTLLGFGFVTFTKPGPANKVCSIQFHDLKNKKVKYITSLSFISISLSFSLFQVEVKVAQTKEALAQQADKARAAVYSQGYG